MPEYPGRIETPGRRRRFRDEGDGSECPIFFGKWDIQSRPQYPEIFRAVLSVPGNSEPSPVSDRTVPVSRCFFYDTARVMKSSALRRTRAGRRWIDVFSLQACVCACELHSSLYCCLYPFFRVNRRFFFAGLRLAVWSTVIMSRRSMWWSMSLRGWRTYSSRTGRRIRAATPAVNPPL